MTDGVEPPELTADRIQTPGNDRFTTDSVALVTGAGSGIGRDTAVALPGNDLAVAATDVDEEGLAGATAKAEQLDVDGEIHETPGDLTWDGGHLSTYE